MENTNAQEEKTPTEEVKNEEPPAKRKKVKLILIIFVIVGVGIVVSAYFAKSLFIAAMVNGKPVSRLSVIKQLEQQSGKQALDSIIEQKLIETELAKKSIVVTKAEVDDEIKKIETQISGQGGTLKQALETQGMTEAKLREQIIVQKKLEKVLADKTKVSNEEADKYITDTKIPIPSDTKPEEFKTQIKDQLERQKFQKEAQSWIADLMKNANIKYFTNY